MSSPVCADRPASAEATSTRPNPFDDTDASSRKRRRTGSPVDETEPPISVLDGSSDETNNFDIDSTADPTAQQSAEREPRRQPSASKVTLNLRQASTTPISLHSSPPRSELLQEGSNLNEEAPAAIHQSVETVVEDSLAASMSRPAPVTPSSREISHSADAMSIQDGEESEEAAALSETVSRHFDLDISGPIPDFPFHNGADEISETLRHIINHINTQSPFPSEVLASVSRWLGTFVPLFQNMDDRAILHVWENGKFWHYITELMHDIVKQTLSTPIILSAEPRAAIIDFYHNFTLLTTTFIVFDYGSLSEYTSRPDRSSAQLPELFATDYLCQLLRPLGFGLPPLRSRDTSMLTDLLRARHDIAHRLQATFQENTEGDWASLHRLIEITTDLVPSIPKLGNDLGPVCQTVEVLARYASRLESEGAGDLAHRRPLDVIHDFWKLLDASIRSTMEKRVSTLTTGSATIQLEALREILKIYLFGRPSLAMEMYQAGRTNEPPLSSGIEAEIVAWEWYFDRLAQLIRSSQMQLRVYAATSMCTSLVNIWRRFSDASDEEERTRLLNRIGSYLLQTNLVNYIFGPNCHPEIILESANIVGFLVINKQYGAEHTEQLWHTITNTQDPRVAEALCRMVTNIATLFDYEGLLGLCMKLQTLPIRSFTPAIRQLWTAVLKSMTDKVHANNAVMSFHPYQLCLQLLRESSVCTNGGSVLCPELQSTALQGLREVLEVGDEETRRQHRQQLFLSCLQDLEAKSNTTLGSLWALSLAIRPAVAAELSLLTEQHELTRLVVEELHHAVQSSQTAGTTSVLCGAPNHPRREFVAQIIQHEPLTLEGKLGTRLWDVLVGHQAACQMDRNAGWDILNSSVRKLSFKNHYLDTCFTDRLPALPRSCFCQGVLEFVRAQVLPLAGDINGSFFEDDAVAGRVGLEQLWRIVTAAEDNKLAEMAIHTLSAEVYLDSPLIQTFPISRTRQLHSSVVTRCLKLLRESARNLRSEDLASNPRTELKSSNEASLQDREDSQRIFDRTIQLLGNFLARYRAKPTFAMPDLRSFMPEAPSQVEGDLTQLKYQSFDGRSQTDVKPLNIGKLNTAASLLASLRQETGFDNYRAFYRGRPFAPTEDDIRKSLEDLQVRDGLILVKKEADELRSHSRVKAGSSPLEVEISGHFDELQSYLDLAEPMARQILDFLTMLPADQQFMRIFEDSTKSHRDIFPPGHPFRTLYAAHTLMPYLDAVQKATPRHATHVDQPLLSSPSEALWRCTTWISDAISDDDLSNSENLELRFEVQMQLMSLFRQLLNVPRETHVAEDLVHPPPEHLVELLSNVLRSGKANQVSELVGQTLAVIFRLGLSSTSTWEKFRRTSGFAILFQDLILRESRQEVRLLLTSLIEDIVALEAQSQAGKDDESVAKGPLTMFFWENFSILLEEAEDHAEQSYELFKTCTALLKTISASATDEARAAIRNTTKELAHLLLRHESIEEPGRPAAFDVFIHSVVAMLQFCLDTETISTAIEVLPSDFAANLINRHLFPRLRETEEEPVPKVILHPETRKQICEVIFRLIQQDRPSVRAVLPVLHRLLPYYPNREDEVYHYDLPYGNFDREKFIRASCGYTGLRNLSNTCYLNSLVNQLYMNPRFRHFLLNANGDSSNKEPKLLNATKRLLSYLQESWNAWVDPEEFVSTLKTFEETPIDVHSQMDVDEFYNLLFDQWEGEMGSSEEKRQLRSFFGGQLVQQVKSKECEHISERLEPFSAIQCDIKGKSTLNASLQAYVDGEIMEGDNKYKCSTCDRHVDAVKRACLKDIPDNLIFHLKRFDFNLRTLQRSKINDYFSFPHEIDMAPYTIEHLSDPSSSETDPFELVGVLVHSGTAESGHYYSYIKERPTSSGRPNWLEFNDEAVSQWDPNFLEHATFGGYDYRSPDDPNLAKSYSAYMLFYQRASTLRAEQDALTSRAVSAPLRVNIDPNLKNHILDENTLLLRRHCLFDLSHPVLVSQCVQEARKADIAESMGLAPMRDGSWDSGSEASDSQPNHELQKSGVWLALNHFDQVVTRAAGLPHFGLYHDLLRTAVTSCTDCAAQILEYFRRRPEAFRSLLQRNQDPGVRRFAGEMLLIALQKVAEERPWAYHPAAPLTPSGSSMTDGRSDDDKVASQQASIPEGMRVVLRHIWKGFHISIRSWDEIFSFVHGFGRLGPHETAVLLSEDWLLKVLRVVAADPAIETRPNYQRMLQALSRRSRPASYTAVISLIDFLLETLEQVMSADSIVEEASERLAVSDPPFPWTSQEVNILLHHPRWRTSSLFVEKLVALEQSPVVTDQILCRLMDAGDTMTSAVFSTLKNNIPGEAAAPLMNPFLRAAVCFIRNTESLDLARKLVFHVAGQAGKLQLGEGLAFVEFFKSIASGGFAQSSFEQDIHEKILENLPDWTPALLVSFEPIVRQATSAFLDEQVFDAHVDLLEQVQMDDDDSPEGPRALLAHIREVVQNLGVNCLVYLRDSHVKPQTPISRAAAESILRVITACRSFCLVDGADSDMEHAAAYRVLYAEVLPALQPLIVEELDADVSEWEGSAASSEVGISDHLAREITDVA